MIGLFLENEPILGPSDPQFLFMMFPKMSFEISVWISIWLTVCSLLNVFPM